MSVRLGEIITGNIPDFQPLLDIEQPFGELELMPEWMTHSSIPRLAMVDEPAPNTGRVTREIRIHNPGERGYFNDGKELAGRGHFVVAQMIKGQKNT